MTSREFLRMYRGDERVLTGAFFSQDPIRVTRGERIGVVLLNLGGPARRTEVETFLYSRWMDPVLERMRVRRGRHYIATPAAKVGAHFLWKEYEQIGGYCPINRLTREQASALQKVLNERLSDRHGVTFRTYVSMRYGEPTTAEVARALQSDGINKVVLLPLYPQYSAATTGSALAYWDATLRRDDYALTTTAVVEYSAHPGYVAALRDRIDQALQRFPRRMRNEAQIVFSAEQLVGGNVPEGSFCAHVRETVATTTASMSKEDVHITFFGSPTRHSAGHPETRQTVQRLATQGKKAVLIVPLGLATDHLWTAYTLDIALRRDLNDTGVEFFEVAAGMNCHPLFISALADMVGQHLDGEGHPAPDSALFHRHIASNGQATPFASDCPNCRPTVPVRNWGGTISPTGSSVQ